ncbi:MAG: hypothetical protein K9K67_02085 [Bacteriovoracaceae bacterium]|nr:hypothetical protein [Bacteriovoracaceae bacterium]
MNKFLINIFFIIIVSLFFFDIGNLDGLRQGTEGFYLLISQEMYEAGDLLTPRIYGQYHWSKPPFQFWLPIPFYHIFGGSFLTSARVAVLIFSLACCVLISLWYQNELKRNWYEAFGFLVCPLYFIKYSRIFMMEMALTYLTTLGALYFFSYLNKRKYIDLFLSSAFSGLSLIVKGPVSFAMLFPPAAIFWFFKTKKEIKPLILFLFFSVLIGSLWFILSYWRFGYEFFNYFFIRENLGKFTAKNYPIRSVIQGLFIYSFPIFLFLIPTIKHTKAKDYKLPINFFFILSFIFFYFLWFIPKQKSHHYAVPSIPILALFICYNYNRLNKTIKQKFLKTINLILSFILFIGIGPLILFFFFREDLELSNSRPFFLGAVFCLGLWSWLQDKRVKKLEILSLVIPLVFYWQFLIPLGILPVAPKKVAVLAQTKTTLFVSYRKPFFIKEALEREIELMPIGGLNSSDIKTGDLVFIEKSVFLNSQKDLHNYKILHSWRVWKRGSRFSQITNAILSKDLKSLQESYTLVQKN